MQLETATAEREEYFETLYDEITHLVRLECMIPLVSFLPQRIRRYGQDLGFNLEKGGIWSKDSLVFGMGVGRFHNIKKLNFGAQRVSANYLVEHFYKAERLSSEILAFLVDQRNLMSGEFVSKFPGAPVDVNCWANNWTFGGSHLDSRNPYSLVSVVDRAIRQGR